MLNWKKGAKIDSGRVINGGPKGEEIRSEGHAGLPSRRLLGKVAAAGEGVAINYRRKDPGECLPEMR